MLAQRYAAGWGHTHTRTVALVVPPLSFVLFSRHVVDRAKSSAPLGLQMQQQHSWVEVPMEEGEQLGADRNPAMAAVLHCCCWSGLTSTPAGC